MEEGDRAGQEDKRGNQKEREIEPVISSLSVLHSPGNTKRFTSWVEKIRGEKEREATWWRKSRVKRGREQSVQ